MPWVMEKMSFLIQICLTYQKFLSNKDRFNKLWIAICKSQPKYVIIPKIAKKYWVCPELYIKNAIFGSKFASLTQNFKANRPFYQTFNFHLQKLIKIWIMQKIIIKSKNATFGLNLPHLPNFWKLAYFFQKFSKLPTFFCEFVSACQISIIYHFVLEFWPEFWQTWGLC